MTSHEEEEMALVTSACEEIVEGLSKENLVIDKYGGFDLESSNHSGYYGS